MSHLAHFSPVARVLRRLWSNVEGVSRMDDVSVTSRRSSVVVKIAIPELAAASLDDISPRQIQTAVEAEFNAYVGPLRHLQGTVVPNMYGLFLSSYLAVRNGEKECWIMVQEDVGIRADPTVLPSTTSTLS